MRVASLVCHFCFLVLLESTGSHLAIIKLSSISQLFQCFYFVDKERQREQIEVERSKIEENIDRLSKDIEKEEDVKQSKREVFIEDLDLQTEEKKAATEKRAVIDKAERFRGNNALASKLSKHLNLDEPVISVSYNS